MAMQTSDLHGKPTKLEENPPEEPAADPPEEPAKGKPLKPAKGEPAKPGADPLAKAEADLTSATYRAALLATAVSVPFAAASLMVVVYLVAMGANGVSATMAGPSLSTWLSQYLVWIGANGVGATVIGGGAAILLWLLVARPLRRFAVASACNTRSYQELMDRLSRLKVRLDAAPATRLEEGLKVAQAECDAIECELRCQDLRWVLATGYVSVWTRLHRAEEAMIMVEPVGMVAGGVAQAYEMRLDGSTMPKKDILLPRLRRATAELSAPAANYLDQGVSGSSAVSPTGGDAADANDDKELARSVLREVVSTVNEYRDDQWDGMVRARNQLMRTIAFVGLFTVFLLGLALIRQVDPKQLVAAVAFYLVGAAVGLFNRLYVDSQADTTKVEDYGLSIGRLLQTPVFCGLAAVGGVLITAMLPLILNGAAVLPPTTTSVATVASAATSGRATSAATGGAAVMAAAMTSDPAPTTTAVTSSATTESSASSAVASVATTATATAEAPQPPPQPIPLRDIYDIDNYPFGFIMAAIFGLTPTLLISRLSEPIEQYKQNLTSTEPTQGS